MSVRIALQAIPNQSFSALLDDITYRITLKESQGAMTISIDLDDLRVVSANRFVTDSPLIPYAYLEGAGGNFVFTSEADALPAYAEFENTQFLIYATAEEVANARA